MTTASDGSRVVSGFIPAKSFTGAVTFFPAQIKPAGFTLVHLAVNAPHDSEGSFRGDGFTGSWTIKTWCQGAMSLQISAKPAS